MYLGGMKTTPVLSTIDSRQRTILLTAAVFGLLGLIFGVFGAHTFKHHITAEDYRDYEKGVQYHYLFTGMIFILGILYGLLRDAKGLYGVFVLFAVGTVLFSGSLYVIATAPVSGLTVPYFLFLVTPLGGFCFLGGWIWLVWVMFRLRTNPLQQPRV